ncbi:unnamed protein product, partial [Ilex paraguariensis]
MRLCYSQLVSRHLVVPRRSRPAPLFSSSATPFVDSGNNNYIDNGPENPGNYKPFAQNGFFKEPTGRFSDGRIIVDYIAHVNGVNFASGGAGILSTTNQGQAIDLKTQLKHFEEVQNSLTKNLGDAETKELLSEAVYFISIGSNDYMGGYLGNPRMQEQHPPEEYVGMIIGRLTQAIQELHEKGGRKFGFLSLPPLGCLPALRALNTKSNEGSCFEEASTLALAHNNALKAVLTRIEHLFMGFKYSNSYFYNWLDDRINNPTKY